MICGLYPIQDGDGIITPPLMILIRVLMRSFVPGPTTILSASTSSPKYLLLKPAIAFLSSSIPSAAE